MVSWQIHQPQPCLFALGTARCWRKWCAQHHFCRRSPARQDRASGGRRDHQCSDRRACGVSRPTANPWRNRYLEHGIAGLVDVQRPGRPKQIDELAIITATLTPPPKSLGVTHWSNRLLAPSLGVHHSCSRTWSCGPGVSTLRLPTAAGCSPTTSPRRAPTTERRPSHATSPGAATAATSWTRGADST